MAIIYGEFINESYTEESMTAKERNRLEDDEFGIPELRKYPLHDKKHVEQAIKMFNHVEKEYESELADNILDAMDRYRISTDTVGEKNRLKKYIKEETIYEGLIWNDKTPNDIKALKEKINNILDKQEKVDDLGDVVDKLKDSIKNRNFESDEKKIILDVCKKCGIKVYGYIISTFTYGGAEISNTHKVIGTYKDYILTFNFTGAKGVVSLPITGIIINYDASKCNIPKNVVFDFISMVNNVDKVKSSKYSVKISALSDAIDSGYPRVSHKYSNKYKVKKNVGGFSITMSTLRSVKESSPVAAAMHRQDFNPNSVYIVNYMKKNTFENDLAICRDKMNSIFICDNGEPSIVSLTDFKEMATDIKVYEFIGDCNFKNIVESSHSGLDFYKNIIEDDTIDISCLEFDFRFTQVNSYINELNSIEECILNSTPKSGIINEIYCPIIPLLEMNVNESNVHYFRDIDGVFAQNIDTLTRSASYKSINDIPKTTINLLRNI